MSSERHGLWEPFVRVGLPLLAVLGAIALLSDGEAGMARSWVWTTIMVYATYLLYRLVVAVEALADESAATVSRDDE